MKRKILAALSYFLLCMSGQLHADADELFIQGVELMNHKKYTEAVHYFDAAIKESPSNPYFWERRGATYHALQNYYQAISDYTIAIALAPKETLFYVQRSLSYMASGNVNAMKSDLVAAAQLGNKDVQELLIKHDIRW